MPRRAGRDEAARSVEPAWILVGRAWIDGRDVEDEQRYSIAGCEREGEPMDMICRHPGAHEPHILPLTVHQAVKEYLNAHPVIAPRRDGREIALDLPRIVFSQDAVLATGDPSTAPTAPSSLPL